MGVRICDRVGVLVVDRARAVRDVGEEATGADPVGVRVAERAEHPWAGRVSTSFPASLVLADHTVTTLPTSLLFLD